MRLPISPRPTLVFGEECTGSRHSPGVTARQSENQIGGGESHMKEMRAKEVAKHLPGTMDESFKFYGSWFIPSVLFYYCQDGPGILLALIVCTQLVLPLLFGGNGELVTLSNTATFAFVMASQMLFYIRDRHSANGPTQIYEILFTWNDRPGLTLTKPHTHPSLAVIRRDACRWFVCAAVQLIMFIPVISIVDSFLRVCRISSEAFNLDWRGAYYLAILGLTLHLHIAMLPAIARLYQSLILIFFSFLPVPMWTQSLYQRLFLFVQRPPLFNKPWLAQSIHELWSRRWHQMFRPIFRRIGYRPMRALPVSPMTGRSLGIFAGFVVSGLMHEYILLTMIGYHRWRLPGVLGYQTLFFLIQAIATIISVAPFFPRLPPWVGRALTFAFVVCTYPLFLTPYVRVGLHLAAELPGFPRFMDPYMDTICPYKL